MLSKRSQRLQRCIKFSRSLTKGIGSEIAGESDAWIRDAKNKHQGETCFIFGNGPSLKHFPFDRIRGYKTFGSNGIYLIHSPDYFVTISNEFYKNHISNIQKLNCERKFLGKHLKDEFPSFDGSFLNCNWNIYGSLLGFKFPVPLRFSPRADKVVYLGGSVIFVCLQLAYFMGFKRVLLAGVDHRFGFPRSEAVYGGRKIEVVGDDKIHFDSKYNPNGHTMHCDVLATERSFELALDTFQKAGREILNLTPESSLNVVPKANLASVL